MFVRRLWCCLILHQVLENKTVALVGDLKNGRTVHSLAQLLACTFPSMKLRLVSPPQLSLPQNVKDTIAESLMTCVSEHEDLDSVVSSADVLYMTRVRRRTHYVCPATILLNDAS